MNKSDIKEVQTAISHAGWNMNLSDFMKVTGWYGGYAMDKFSSFQELAALINIFDAETLAKILGIKE